MVNMPKVPLNLPKSKPNLETHKNEDDYKKMSNKKWGNGRDWSSAASSEGSWVRICPFNLDQNKNCSGSNIKLMVTKIMKFNKCAKDLAKTHPTASECQLNEFLQHEMGLTGEVWIPPV